MIERGSKSAAMASVASIVALLLAIHPDMTWTLRTAIAAAFLLAVLAGRRYGDRTQAACLLAAPLLPVFLRLATGREQPVLDLVWMAALGAALLRSVPWTTWALPPLWRPLAAGWALALSLVWPVIVARESGFDAATLYDTGAVNSWALWSASQAISWNLYWILMHLLGLLWLDWLRARLLARPHTLPAPAHALWIGVSIASVVAVVQGTIDLTFLSTPFWAALGRATGTMLDANGYGHSAAIAGPVAFVVLRAARPSAPAWAWAALAVNWSGMWMSGSRTALLCAVAGAAGLLVAFWQSRDLGPRRQLMAGTLVLAVVAVVLVLVGGATGPIRRLTEVPLDRESLTQFWVRGGYGSIATQMFREYPLTGVGAGSFHYLAPDYWRALVDDALPPDNAQNWWRHHVAELGVAGGSLLMAWSVVLAWRVLTGAGRRRSAGPIVRGLLVGVGLSSLLGVPTQNPVVLLWFFLLVGWLETLVPARGWPALQGSLWTRPSWAVALVAAVTYAAGHLVLSRSSLAVVERAVRFQREYIVGTHAPEAYDAAGHFFRWTGRQSRFLLPVQAPWLALRVWASHPDIASNPVRVTISTPCGVLWNETIGSPEPLTLGVALPPGARMVEAEVRVSRTWKPSEHGHEDTRALGVAIATDFLRSAELARSQMYTLVWPVCDNALLPSAGSALPGEGAVDRSQQ